MTTSRSMGTRLDRLPAVPKQVVLKHNHDLMADWLDWLRQHGRKPRTVYAYGGKADRLLQYLGREPFATVDLDRLERWVARPRERRGHGQIGADSTRANDVAFLRGFWGWAVAHGHLAHNPTADLELPTVRNDDPKAVDATVWRQFWGSPLDDVQRVAFGLCFYCGLRREEVCRLKVGNVDLAGSGRIIDFPRKGDRGKRVSGTVPVVSLARLWAQEHPTLLHDPADLLEPLRDLCAARGGSEWVLPWGGEPKAAAARWTAKAGIPAGMTNPDQINWRLRAALRDAGMPLDAFTPHALRHSFVTYLLRCGVRLEVVSRLANHSKIDTTLKYARLADDPIAEMLTAPPSVLDSTNLKGQRWGD